MWAGQAERDEVWSRNLGERWREEKGREWLASGNDTRHCYLKAQTKTLEQLPLDSVTRMSRAASESEFRQKFHGWGLRTGEE